MHLKINSDKVKALGAHATALFMLFGGLGIIMFSRDPVARQLGYFMVGLVLGAALNEL